MRRRFSGIYRALRSAIPWFALGGALALTATTWIAMERGRTAHARMHFNLSSQAAAEQLSSRVAAYEEILRAGAARVASTPATTPPEWYQFVSYLQLPERFPAMPRIEYRPASSALHDGDAVRAAAAARAIASGETTISAALAPEATAQQPSIAMFVPVTRPGNGRGPKAIGGIVSGLVHIYDLTHGVLDDPSMDGIDTRIYDGPRLSPDRLLADTRSAGAATPPLFERVVELPLAGRTWTLQFLSRPDLEEAIARDRPFGLLAAGLVASVLTFLLARSVTSHLERAQHLSMRDPLTGLYNRRYLENSMERELNRARRAGATIGVVMLDVDHFKRLNDSRGHDAGDFVLVNVAAMLAHAARGSDIACRFGGEEFALILPGASLEVARDRAESIRAAFAGARFEFNGEPLVPMTLSAGVAALVPGDADWSQGLHQADRALYTAKRAGRNRVLAVARE